MNQPNEEQVADVKKFLTIYKFSISQTLTMVSDAYGLDPEALRFAYHQTHCQACKKTQNGGNN